MRSFTFIIKARRSILIPWPLYWFSSDLDSVDLDGQEWANENEISNVTSVMKMWLRELPDPLLTYALHQGFLEAASTCSTIISREPRLIVVTTLEIENERLRQIRLHERVNDLPDPNYSTLKYFLGHLHRLVRARVIRYCPSSPPPPPYLRSC